MNKTKYPEILFKVIGFSTGQKIPQIYVKYNPEPWGNQTNYKICEKMCLIEISNTAEKLIQKLSENRNILNKKLKLYIRCN